MAVKQLSDGNPDGTVLGQSAAGDKISFYNVTPVVQSTGYGTPTGNAQLANFPGATATLVQTSGELAQLIVDLKKLGLIGA